MDQAAKILRQTIMDALEQFYDTCGDNSTVQLEAYDVLMDIQDDLWSQVNDAELISIADMLEVRDGYDPDPGDWDDEDDDDWNDFEEEDFDE